jgi:hypothetical protein
LLQGELIFPLSVYLLSNVISLVGYLTVSLIKTVIVCNYGLCIFVVVQPPTSLLSPTRAHYKVKVLGLRHFGTISKQVSKRHLLYRFDENDFWIGAAEIRTLDLLLTRHLDS